MKMYYLINLESGEVLLSSSQYDYTISYAILKHKEYYSFNNRGAKLLICKESEIIYVI